MEKPFSRDIEEKIMPFIDRDEIVIVRGPRQAGKTTLLEIVAGKIKYKKEFVDLDVASSRNAVGESPTDYVKRFLDNGRLALFLDEIQRLDGAGEKMKILYDRFKGQVKIFASGSSSLEIRSKVLGFLVGRAVLFDLYTFSFGEFVRAKDKGLYNIFKERNSAFINFVEKGTPIPTPSFSEELLEMWKEYVVFGGYPEVIKAERLSIKGSLLSNLVDLYIEKDIASFFKIEDTKEFEGFVKILAFNDSQVLVLSNTAKDANLSFYRAKSYLNILENTYVTRQIYPYYKNTSTSIRKATKIYFLDLGLRNSVLKNLLPYDNRDDSGRLAENFVFRELLALDKEIRYWRTKGGAEMDFVLEIDGKPFPIEVKLGGSGALGKSFYSFIEVYKPKRAIVVTLDEFSKRKVGGTVIYFIPAFYL